jgi:succinate dehydrogenase / fumarate reductase cytochrome b subunit
MAQRPRPLSPFMHYRWQYTNTLSILHRLTGILLAAAFLLLVYWLVAAASGADKYDEALDCLGSPLAQVAIFGALASFCYHLLNGIRHLFFDFGVGFELATARKSGWAVVLGSIVLTFVVCALAWSRLGGSP